jgi:hypothetical protein
MKSLVRNLCAIAIAVLFLMSVEEAHGQTATADNDRPKVVSYNGQNYFVEQSPGGFALKITPQGTPVPIGVVDIRQGRVTAMDPNNYDTVKGVYEAYKSGGSQFAAPELPTRAAAVEAKSGTTTAVSPQVKFTADGGAVFQDSAFGEITISPDGTKASVTRNISNALAGNVTVETVAEYKGGENPGAGKAAGIAKGGARAVLQALNPRVHTHVDTRGNDEWVVSQVTDGKKAPLAGTGDATLYSMYDLYQRDPEKARAAAFLKSVNSGLAAAMAEADKRRAAGEDVKFNPAASLAGQNALRELKRFEEAKH